MKNQKNARNADKKRGYYSYAENLKESDRLVDEILKKYKELNFH
jgi:hypothetical protein